MSLLFIDKFFV